MRDCRVCVCVCVGVRVTHQSSGLVVVQVDSSPGVLTCLLRIHVLFGNPLPEIHVITAATPQPATTTCTHTSISLEIKSPTKTPIEHITQTKMHIMITKKLFKCPWYIWNILINMGFNSSPIFPFFDTSQPQLSRSPRLQFLVRVYMTPAALMAWMKEVSLVAVREGKWTVIYLSNEGQRNVKL